MEYPNGRVYDGEFFNGKMHGKGKFSVYIDDLSNKVAWW